MITSKAASDALKVLHNKALQLDYEINQQVAILELEIMKLEHENKALKEEHDATKTGDFW
jgi:hypothetical protein